MKIFRRFIVKMMPGTVKVVGVTRVHFVPVLLARQSAASIP